MLQSSGESRNFGRRFLLVINPRCRGLQVQTPATKEVLMFKACNVVKFYLAIQLGHFKLLLVGASLLGPFVYTIY